jgi:hypothetical protein
MKRVKHSPEQIVRLLRDAEKLVGQGKRGCPVLRGISVAVPTMFLLLLGVNCNGVVGCCGG